MSRKKDTLPKTVAPRPVPWRRWLFKVLVLLLLVVGAVGGLIYLGQWALEEIRHQDRYNVPFADIDCTPPPGLTRGEFLDEVVYLSRPKDPLKLLDEDLPRKLTAAFAKHPWVEKVDGVSVQPPRPGASASSIASPFWQCARRMAWSQWTVRECVCPRTHPRLACRYSKARPNRPKAQRARNGAIRRWKKRHAL